MRAATGRSLAAAAALGTALWLPVDRFHDPDARWATASAADVLTRTGVPVVLTGQTPWRPLDLLSSGRYAEESTDEPGYRERRTLWSTATAGADPDPRALDDLAARFRLSPAQLRSAVRLAESGGMPLDTAVRRVLAATPGRLADVRTPTRDPSDLVLPAEQAQQIGELAAAFRAWPKVSQEWGFGGQHGGPGLKALFTGEPGTGKTLAAEVDRRARSASTCSGSTSRRSSPSGSARPRRTSTSAFSQAEESRGRVLLFDEADAALRQARRGQAAAPTDTPTSRSATCCSAWSAATALVVLATNLQGNLDTAFTRRFQFVVHFTRPGDRERYRLWRMAFPAQRPAGPAVDLEGLARLDLTGAGIMAAARGAALLAAESGSAVIGREHLAEAIARQFRQESRLPRSGELELALGPVPVRDSAASVAATASCVLP